MKVLHSGTLAASAGGPAMSTYLTLKGLRQLGIDAQIIMFPPEEGDSFHPLRHQCYFSYRSHQLYRE